MSPSLSLALSPSRQPDRTNLGRLSPRSAPTRRGFYFPAHIGDGARTSRSLVRDEGKSIKRLEAKLKTLRGSTNGICAECGRAAHVFSVATGPAFFLGAITALLS